MAQQTRVWPITKEHSVLLAWGAENRGNGGDRHAPLGCDQAGIIFRDLMQAALDWSGVYQVVSIHLVFTSGEEVPALGPDWFYHLPIGADREFRVQRVSELWSSGGGGESLWETSSPTVYPGPSVTGVTADTSAISLSGDLNTTQRLDITNVAEVWAPDDVLKQDGATYGDAETNYGFRIVSTDEADTAHDYELHSIRTQTPTLRPYLELTYLDNFPPNVPTVTEPDEGYPAVVSSTDADTLPVEFLFSDPNPADTCSRVELQVYGEAATDASPGTQLATTGGVVPTPLGSLDAFSVTLDSLTPRTNQRYRLRVRDSEGMWGDYTPLLDGLFFLAFTVGAPLQPQMDTTIDSPHIYGSLNSNDADDYITGWQGEFYEDTPTGAVPLWTDEQSIGGTSTTRTDITWGGVQLRDGQVVRWRQRHRNRDDQWGEWSTWQSTTMVYVAPESADDCSPTDTSTKLTTRTPTLTIAHSSSFDGYRLRLYRDGSEIYDTGEQDMSAAMTKPVVVPAGYLRWGDGADTPLTWGATIRLDSGSEYGNEVTFPIRINSLPSTTATIDDLSGLEYVATADPTIQVPYQDVDRHTYAEWPEAQEVELREAGATSGAGALVERRQNVAYQDDVLITESVAVGRQLDAFTSSSGWSTSTVTPSDYSATNPTGYSGTSVQFAAAAVPDSSSGASVKSITVVPAPGDYGGGAYLRCQRRVTSTTNLLYWVVTIYENGGSGYARYLLAESGDTLDTWAEVEIPLANPAATFGEDGIGETPDRIAVAAYADGGAYTGNLQVRDLRIGTVANDKDSPTGDLVAATEYEVRSRYRDDADAKTTATTLAANSSAGATNVKVTAVTGLEVGDQLTITSDGVPETRTITVVGTAGAGGTGVTVSEGYTWAHSSADAVVVRYWGPWTQWQRFTYQDASTVTLAAPADTGTVNDPTRTLSWSATGTVTDSTVYVWERVGSDDELVYIGTVDDDTASYALPAFLLEDGKTYAWQVVATNDLGLDGESATWTFDTSFTTPTALTGMAAATDEDGSSVMLTWTVSGDSYLHHYRVYWQRANGTWQRVDGGPVYLDDGETALDTNAFTHYGARLGTNLYRVTAHNGAQESDPAYFDATALTSNRPGSFVIASEDGTLASPVNPSAATRTRNPLVETFRPPGRGSSIHLHWGDAGLSADLTFEYVIGEDGDISALLDVIIAAGGAIYVKWPSAYGFDPLLGLPTQLKDNPTKGGLVSVTLHIEEQEA